MNHDQAIREQAVERYLLGELDEEARARFEEHFFDCAICAADLKSTAMFVEALRTEPQPTTSPQRGMHVVAKRAPSAWLRPWLVPALAASLLVIAYQNVVVLPGMRRATTAVQSPALMSNIVLANIDARGSDIPRLSASAHGAFVISLDIPTKADDTSYICSLYNSSGERLWQMPVPAQQAENTVFLRVPTDKAVSGQNELRVFGVPSSGGAPAEVGRYRFNLQISQ
jgi:anti-sigma factor RsiW